MIRSRCRCVRHRMRIYGRISEIIFGVQSTQRPLGVFRAIQFTLMHVGISEHGVLADALDGIIEHVCWLALEKFGEKKVHHVAELYRRTKPRPSVQTARTTQYAKNLVDAYLWVFPKIFLALESNASLQVANALLYPTSSRRGVEGTAQIPGRTAGHTHLTVIQLSLFVLREVVEREGRCRHHAEDRETAAHFFFQSLFVRFNLNSNSADDVARGYARSP